MIGNYAIGPTCARKSNLLEVSAKLGRPIRRHTIRLKRDRYTLDLFPLTEATPVKSTGTHIEARREGQAIPRLSLPSKALACRAALVPGSPSP